MLKQILSGGPIGRDTNSSTLSRILSVSPLLIAGYWFFFRTERGVALRGQLMDKVSSLVGSTDLASTTKTLARKSTSTHVSPN